MPHPVLLRSFLLDRALPRSIPHAFTTRLGGLSPAPFNTLNFGNPSELPPDRKDPAANIAANRALLFAALGLADRTLADVWQVHGGHVHTVRPGDPAPVDIKADAIVTDDPARVIAVRIADCAPILLASTDGRIVAAVHAGWRGVLARVLPSAISTMRSLGATTIAAAIGPCIGPHAFEVGPEVADQFRAAFPDEAPATGHQAPVEGDAESTRRIVIDPPSPAHRPHINLKAALAHQLRAAGVAPSHFDILSHCTHADPALFFSHRRDHINSGRLLACIAPLGAE